MSRESQDFEIVYDVFSWKSSEDVDSAVEEIIQGCEALEIVGCALFEEEVDELMANTARSDKMKALRFSNCELDEVVALFLRKMYLYNRIVFLDMSKSSITSYDVQSFSSFLRDNLALKYFNLSQNQLDDEAIEALGMGLKRNSSLAVLNLAENQIKLEELTRPFIDYVAVSKYLIHLDLRGNKVESDGAKFLAAAVRENKSLIFLDTSENPMEKHAVGILAMSVPASLYHVGSKIAASPQTRNKKRKAKARASMYLKMD